MGREQRQLRTGNLNNFKYTLEYMDAFHKAKSVDTRDKSEYTIAAKLLMDEYNRAATTRSMPDVVANYVNAANEKQLLRKSGWDAVPKVPPENWPFDVEEWKKATSQVPWSLLDRAMAYSMYEKERLFREHRALYKHGVNAVDFEQLARLKVSEDKGRRIARRNWSRRLKGELVEQDSVNTSQPPPTPTVIGP